MRRISDPRGYIEDARRLNERNESFRKVAKFSRKWRRGCKKENPEFRLKSFHLELVDNDLLKKSPHFDTLDAIEAFFDMLETYLVSPHFPDRANNGRYVDKYVEELKPGERADIRVRIKAARSTVAAMITLRPRRFADALRIVDPKAQNVAVLAGSLISADAEVVAERGIPSRDPAVRLLAAQLIWVCDVDGTDHDFSSLIAECHRRMQAQQTNPVA